MYGKRFFVFLSILTAGCFLSAFQNPSIETLKSIGEEKQAIGLFSNMCLLTGGEPDRIEKKLKGGIKIEPDKIQQTWNRQDIESAWRVNNPVSAEKPYMLIITKGGGCFIGFPVSDSEKLRQVFKSFIYEQAVGIKSEIIIPSPDIHISPNLNVDFYDMPVPNTKHVLKFSLATPKTPNSSYQATMMVMSE